NSSEVTKYITTVEQPDTTPPVIEALVVPSSAASGEEITIRCDVKDDREVSKVEFYHGITLIDVVYNAPYETTFTLPDIALPGSVYSIEARAYDSANNRSSKSKEIEIIYQRDTTAPQTVTLTSPAEAVPGAMVRLDASAVDDRGVLKVVFLANNIAIAEDTTEPYSVEYKIPPEIPPGSRIVFSAEAIDFSGNKALSNEAVTSIIEPSKGFVTGEVYDVSTGLPLPGAKVEILSVGGRAPDKPIESITDSHGQYRFFLPQGKATLSITKEGYTSCFREVNVEPDRIVSPLDAHLTPLNTFYEIQNIRGGSVILDKQTTLYVPPGTLSTQAGVYATTLTGQALPGLLPPGWSPLEVVYLGPEGLTLNNPVEIRFNNVWNFAPVVTYWDNEKHSWIRFKNADLTSDGYLIVNVISPGIYALLRPDSAPLPPPEPEVGEPIKGVDLLAIPEGVTADILPRPEIIFMQPGAKSDVEVVLNNKDPLPSGTPIQVDFNETYDMTSGDQLTPPGMTRDFILYQSSEGFLASFIASPSEQFDPVNLKEGVIRLTAHRPERADGTGIIGPLGGSVSTPSGFTFNVPQSAFPEPVAVVLEDIKDSPFTDNPDVEYLGGINLNLVGNSLAQSGELSLTLSSPIAEGSQVLVVKAVRFQTATQYEIVSIATLNGNTLTATANSLGLPLEGIKTEGRYYFLRLKEPAGFVTGRVLKATGPSVSGIVEDTSLKFVSLIDSENPYYVQAIKIGPATINGKDLTDGSSAYAEVEIAEKGQILSQDLSLTESRPTVLSVIPEDGATNVSLTSTVTVRFSRPIDSSSIDTSTFVLSDGTKEVEGMVSLLNDGVTAVFQPNAPLSDETQYRVILSASIKDTYGNPLFGNQPDGSFESVFSTVDLTPPPRPAPGTIKMYIPDSTGMSMIVGSPGTVNPTDTVYVLNETTGETVTAFINPDGSFQANIRARLIDKLYLKIADTSGNETSIKLGPFKDDEGRVGVGPEGGEIRAKNGMTLIIPEGAFPEGAVVRFTAISEDQIGVSAPTPDDRFIAAFDLELSTPPQKYLNWSIPAPSDIDPTVQGVIAEVIDVGGKKRLAVVDTLKIKDGKITTSSPPCPGITHAGRYGAYMDVAHRRRAMLNINLSNYRRELIVEPVIELIDNPFVALFMPFFIVSRAQLVGICMPVSADTNLMTIRDAGTGNIIDIVRVFPAPDEITTIGYQDPEYTMDKDPPHILDIFPVNKRLDLYNDKIEVRFSEPINIEAPDNLVLKRLGGIEEYIDGHIELRENNTLLIFTPYTHVKLRDFYAFTLDKANIKDLSGNEYKDGPIFFITYSPRILSRFVDVGTLKDLDFETTPSYYSPDFKWHTDIFTITSSGYLSAIDLSNPTAPQEIGRIGTGFRYSKRIRLLKDINFIPRGGVIDGWNTRELHYLLSDPDEHICSEPDTTNGFYNSIELWRMWNKCDDAIDNCPSMSICGDLAVVTGIRQFEGFITETKFYDVSDRTDLKWSGKRNLSYRSTVFSIPSTPRGLGQPTGLVLVPDVDIRHEYGGAEFLNTNTVGAYVANQNIGLQQVDVGRNIPSVSELARKAGNIESLGTYPFPYYNDVALMNSSGLGPVVVVLAGGMDIYGGEGIPVLDVFTPDLQPIGQYAEFPSGFLPYRLAVAPGFPVYDDQGNLTRHDLVFVSGKKDDGTGGIAIVEIRENGAEFKGIIPIPGRTKHVEFDPETLVVYTTASIDTSGNDTIVIVDVSDPFKSFDDTNRDGWGDKVIGEFKADGIVHSFKIDQLRNLLYLATSNGLEVIENNACTDLQIDFVDSSTDTTIPVEIEKKALQMVFQNAFSNCDDTEGITVIEQGSGACIWKPEGCGENYKPGISDHDFEIFIPGYSSGSEFLPGYFPGSNTPCIIKELYKQVMDITGKPKPIEVDGYEVVFRDITFYPVPKNEFEDALLNVFPPQTPGGDITGDMGLGRQLLLLKWLIEGEYIDVPGLDLRGKPFEEILPLLKQPYSVITDEPSRIPRLEGYEWTTLQEYKVYSSGALIRLRIPGISESNYKNTTIYKSMQKDLHEVAKAAIRAAIARLVADTEANPLVVDVPLDSEGDPLCLEATGDEPFLWPTVECDSFEHYAASAAARLYRDHPEIEIFTLDEVLKIYDFYKVKAGKKTIETDDEADVFIRDAITFIKNMKQETRQIYDDTIYTDPYSSQRIQNMNRAASKIRDAISNGKKHIIPRVVNTGSRKADVKAIMFTHGDRQEVQFSIEAGKYRMLDYMDNVPVFVFNNVPQDNISFTGEIHFILDTDSFYDKMRIVEEPDRFNNWTHLVYYVITPDGYSILSDTSELPPPPYDDEEWLDGEPRCHSPVIVNIRQEYNGLSAVTVPAADSGVSQEICVDVIVGNQSQEVIKNLKLYSTLTQSYYEVSTLQPGESTSFQICFNLPQETGEVITGQIYVVEGYDQSGASIPIELRTNPFYARTGCRYEIVEPDPNPHIEIIGAPNVSELMYGGKAYQHFRVVDWLRTFNAGGANVFGAQGKNVVVDFITNDRVITKYYTTDDNGYVVLSGTASSNEDWPGMEIPWEDWMNPLITSSQPGSAPPAEYTVHAKVDVPDLECVKEKEFDLVLKPYSYQKVLKVSSETAMGEVELKYKNEIYFDLSTEKRSIDEYKGLNAGQTREFGVGVSSDSLVGRRSRPIRGIRISIGLGVGGEGAMLWGHEYSFGYPLSTSEKNKLAMLVMDSMISSLAGLHPLSGFIHGALSSTVQQLIWNPTKSKFGATFKVNGSLSLGMIGKYFNITGVTGSEIAFSTEMESDHQTGEQKLTTSYSGKWDASIVADLGRDTTDEFKAVLGEKIIGMESASNISYYSVVGNVDKLGINFSGEKRYGRTFGSSGKKSTVTIETTDTSAVAGVASSISIFNGIVSSMFSQAGSGGSQQQQIALGPRRTMEYILDFVHLSRKDLDITFTEEWGQGWETTRTTTKYLPWRFAGDEAVSYTLAKYKMKGGRLYRLEEYPSMANTALMEIEDLAEEVWSTVEESLRSFAHEVSSIFSDTEDRGVIQSSGSAKLTIYGKMNYDKVGGLLSFNYSGLAGPTRPYPYSVEGSIGPLNKPHYGIGGFHVFWPVDHQDDTFTTPATLVIDYTDDEVLNIDENDLAIYMWSPERRDWEFIGGVVDPGMNTVTAEVTKIATYAVGPTMPAGKISWQVDDVQVLEDEGVIRVTLVSSKLLYNTGSTVQDGTTYHVMSILPYSIEGLDEYGMAITIPFGTIQSPSDLDPETEYHQVTSTGGILRLVVDVPTDIMYQGPEIVVFSDHGTAFGDEVLSIKTTRDVNGTITDVQVDVFPVE
ncbi:MAG: hypothetical protein GXO97_00105, partial [Nitrospirae bacterium]|nr:hypothetical protein [Nitrospirota bacterium]